MMQSVGINGTVTEPEKINITPGMQEVAVQNEDKRILGIIGLSKETFAVSDALTDKARLTASLGLPSDATDKQIANEIQLSKLVDQFIEKLPSLDAKHVHRDPLNSVLQQNRIEFPHEFLRSSEAIQVNLQEKYGQRFWNNFKDLATSVSCMIAAFSAQSVMGNIAGVGMGAIALYAAGTTLVSLLEYFKCESCKVALPKSLDHIENQSVKKLREAADARGFKVHYGYNSEAGTLVLAGQNQGLEPFL